MNKHVAVWLWAIAIAVWYIVLPATWVSGSATPMTNSSDKPAEAIRGGEWIDDFWIGNLEEAENIDVQLGHLLLKFQEQLHWTQTWTAHFSGGEFYQTEAISDSVRLAWNESEQRYYATGTYTSIVFDAGKAVDWSMSEWRYSGIPDGVVIAFRTGNTPIPDGSWTDWQLPIKALMEYTCVYTYNTDGTQCFTNLRGIDSNRFLQYRASFESNDAIKTIELYEIDFVFGTHFLTGTAVSILVPPIDLLQWKNVIIHSSTPANTSLSIDLLAPDGTVLLTDLKDGDSLAGIDPIEFPALQLRASFSTTDESISPDIDLWGLQWSAWRRIYLPVLFH